jgi:hypothetical protein
LTPKRWAQIRDIFERAIESEDRSAFVAEACRGDEDLRREVESLLACDSESDCAALDRPVWEAAEDLTAQAFRPRCLGKYKILGTIGEGGMGVVYQAEQEHPRRIVALKVIRPGCANQELLRRFELESQRWGVSSIRGLRKSMRPERPMPASARSRISRWRSFAGRRCGNTSRSIAPIFGNGSN